MNYITLIGFSNVKYGKPKLYNFVAIHGAVVVLNLFILSIGFNSITDERICEFSHLPVFILQDLDAFSAAVIVSIAFSFIPASFAVPIVKVM